MDVMAMAREERTEIADFLESLTPEQWDQESLCRGWTIRDVATHVISYEEHGQPDVMKRFRKAGFRFGRLNDIGIEEYSDLSTEELVAFYRAHPTPQNTTARLGGRVGLVDAMIHHQDMRRPLGMPRRIPAERLRVALPFTVAAPPLRGFWRTRGVRVVATDLDWSWGRGPEARGDAEAVLMVLAGRPGVANELTGPGASVLQQRLG